MKKLNSLKLTVSAAFMICFMAVAFICGTVNVKAESSVKPATLSVDTTGALTITADQKFMDESVIKVIKDTPITGGTVKAGNYYFYHGKAANLTAAKEVPTAVINTQTFTANAFNVGNITKEGTTFTSSITPYSGVFNGKFYRDGALTSMYYVDFKTKVVKFYKNGILNPTAVNGVFSSTKNSSSGWYYHAVAKAFVHIPTAGVYAKNGKLANGLSGLFHYTNGLRSTGLTGWKKNDGKIYYFVKGTALTGWRALPSYGKGVKHYTYLFNKNGVLYTNLINYYGYKKLIQKDIKIIVNKKTHNTTFYVKDKRGNYTVPVVTAVCATARRKGDTPTGTYRLEKTSAKRWYVYTKTHGSPYRYYQWAVHIKGTPSLFHSSTYRAARPNTLRRDLYNQLGTSCTTHCVRHQAKYAKLIYDIATKTNKKRRVPVQIIKSANEGPFGHVTIKKLKKGTNWDPTDPNKK